MRTGRTTSIYTIPAGEPFADTLAAWILQRAADAPDALPHYKVFLPTRRACRIARDAFLRQSEGRPLLLPRLQALGDIDADELESDIVGLIGAEAMPAIPPAIDATQRKILMTRLILARPDFTGGMEQALMLADALARLFDSLHTENVPLSRLATLVPEDFSDHWKISLDFLTLIAESWHEILSERGVIDPADRRNRLMRLLTEHWTRHPPPTPIIAAGSTGSIPSTAALLKLIATLPQGCVILPGLDTRINDADRDTIPESHPQFLMMRLLAHCDVNISGYYTNFLRYDTVERENTQNSP